MDIHSYIKAINVRHGDLATYVKSNYEENILNICPDSSLWEGLFVEITSTEDKNDKFIIGDVYKPPRENNNYLNITNFINEIEPIIDELNNSKKRLPNRRRLEY